MDGPNVNHKFYKELVKIRKSQMFHKMIDIGSCTLHILSGSFKTGAEKSSWDIQKTLKGSYQILHDTPARREDYETVTNSNLYPKNVVPHIGWKTSVADRLVEMWPDIRKLFRFWNTQKGPQPSQKTTKSIIDVKPALEDPFTEAEIRVFSFIASKIEPFLKKYQPDSMIVYMYSDLKDLIKSLLRLIVKADVLQVNNSGVKMKEIDLHNGDNLLPIKDIDIGFASESEIKKLRTSDAVNLTQIRKFREGSQLFVINVLLKLFERSPLGSVLLRRSVELNPTLTLTVTKEMQRCLKGLLAHLIDLNIIILTTCDTVADQFSRHKQKFENFEPKILVWTLFTSKILILVNTRSYRLLFGSFLPSVMDNLLLRGVSV